MPSYYDDTRRDQSGAGRRPDGDAPLSLASLETRRERALERLTQAYAGDLVSLEEYERRAEALQLIRDPAELEKLVADLPRVSPAEPSTSAGRRRPSAPSGPRESRTPNRVEPSLTGAQTIACVMGDRQMTGDWLSGDRVDAFTMMGSIKIDLRDTAIPDGRLRVEAFVLMGETKIIVPRGLPVRMSLFPFMGEARIAREVEQRVVPGEPFVEVSGFAMMGSVVVVAMD